MRSVLSSSFNDEIKSGVRFEFGKNWSHFLATVSDERIAEAETALANFLQLSDLKNLRFLDIGCGSGLSSLAAFRLGADVTSFDYDPYSVETTNRLKTAFAPQASNWKIMAGSALDKHMMRRLGEFDIVYSWGVLHHTGNMMDGLALAAERVSPGGLLFVAIYNDQGRMSSIWRVIKKTYCRIPRSLQLLVIFLCLIRLWGPTILRDTCRLRPLRTLRDYRKVRGMNPWHDVVDWVGGYPFEVAKPEQIFEFYRDQGFTLQMLKTCGGGIGCNEFLFRRSG